MTPRKTVLVLLVAAAIVTGGILGGIFAFQALNHVGGGPDQIALDITNPATSDPAFVTAHGNLTVSFTLQKDGEPVSQELADIRVAQIRLGGQPCFVITDPSRSQVRGLPDLPFTAWMIDAATVRGKAYIVGGRTGTRTSLDTILEFDPVANSSRVVYHLPTPLSLASVVGWDDKVYILGGWEDWQEGAPVSTVRVYDPMTNTSSIVGTLPEPRYWGAASVAGGRIYYGGGYSAPSGSATHGDIFEFDPTTGVSRKAQVLPSPRVILSATSAYGKVYFIGGNKGNGDVQTNEIVEYDPVVNTSAVVATFPPPRGVSGMEGQTAVTLNGKIYIFNGWIPRRNAGTRDEIFEFDPRTKENAVLVGTLREGVELGAAVDIYGRGYLFGGFRGTDPSDFVTEFTPPSTTAQFSLSSHQWQAMCSVPTGLLGSQDLYVRANYIDHRTNVISSSSDTEPNAVVVAPALDVTPPSPPWRLIGGATAATAGAAGLVVLLLKTRRG